jgi:hypothetical protein
LISVTQKVSSDSRFVDAVGGASVLSARELFGELLTGELHDTVRAAIKTTTQRDRLLAMRTRVLLFSEVLEQRPRRMKAYASSDASACDLAQVFEGTELLDRTVSASGHIWHKVQRRGRAVTALI